MKRLVLFILLLRIVSPVAAAYDPLSVPNNRFGIHIADPNDIPSVASLVNSTGGDWGYVTIVIPQTDQNTQAWQQKFDELRRLHLIPIVRLATRLEDTSWARPKKEDIPDWVSFLNSLNWPVANRYIVLFNEPNHAKEWGNTIDPEGYADVLVSFAKALKESNEDFFILPAGLDASAASDGNGLDEAEYLRRMVAAKPDLLEYIDGWISHSYPNPGFSGSPYGRGRGTLGTFAWELAYLRELGFKKDLPVFITETGWVHSEGKFWQPRLLKPEEVGAHLQIAAASVWKDSRIVAITPFVFNYQDYPFDHFSFTKLGNSAYYPHYDAYRIIPKQKGVPMQRESYEVSHPLLLATLVASSRYHIATPIKNTGQGILTPDEYNLVLESAGQDFHIADPVIPRLEPQQRGNLSFTLGTPETTGPATVSVVLLRGRQRTILEARTIMVIPPPVLSIRARLGWRRTNDADDVKVLFYKGDDLLMEFAGRKLTDGFVGTPGLTGIIPGEQYRVVLVIPSYLPVQTQVTVRETTISVSMPRMFPLDFIEDGALTAGDIVALLQLQPAEVLSRFFGN